MVLTIDNIRNLFASGKEPIADFYFSGDMPSVMGAVRAMPEFPIAEIALATLIAMATIITSLTTTHGLIRNVWMLTDSNKIHPFVAGERVGTIL